LIGKVLGWEVERPTYVEHGARCLLRPRRTAGPLPCSRRVGCARKHPLLAACGPPPQTARMRERTYSPAALLRSGASGDGCDVFGRFATRAPRPSLDIPSCKPVWSKSCASNGLEAAFDVNVRVFAHNDRILGPRETVRASGAVFEYMTRRYDSLAQSGRSGASDTSPNNDVISW